MVKKKIKEGDHNVPSTLQAVIAFIATARAPSCEPNPGSGMRNVSSNVEIRQHLPSYALFRLFRTRNMASRAMRVLSSKCSLFMSSGHISQSNGKSISGRATKPE